MRINFNPKYAIELSLPCVPSPEALAAGDRSGKVFRSKITVNQPLCSSYDFNHSGAMLCIHNSLIQCSFESHNEIYRIIRVKQAITNEPLFTDLTDDHAL